MTETKKIKVYICDVCGAERNGEPHKLYIDAPYSPYISKNKLSKVCDICIKQVQEVDPMEHEKDES
jgi:hypothetical protein